MVFKDYLYGIWKKEITELLRKRITIKDKIRYHRQKIEHFETEVLPKIEAELNDYLKRAGNKV